MELTIEQKLALIEKLLIDTRLSKSEVRVFYFCYMQSKTAKEITEYLAWASPNVSRLLLTMTNKGMLNRILDEVDHKTYIYTSNNEFLN